MEEQNWQENHNTQAAIISRRLTIPTLDMNTISIGVEIPIKQTFGRFLQAILVDFGETITGRMSS